MTRGRKSTAPQAPGHMVGAATMAHVLRKALWVSDERGKQQADGGLSQAVALGALRACLEIVIEQLEAGADPDLRLQVYTTTVRT